MSDHPITLSVSEQVFDRMRHVAETVSESVEEVAARRLEAAFPEPLPVLAPHEEAELEALAHLSDDALWTMAREQMADALQARMQILMDKNSLGTITADEYSELENLVDRGQRLMLRKAEAAALLTERGNKVTRADLGKQTE